MTRRISNVLIIFLGLFPLLAQPRDRIIHPIDPSHSITLSQPIRAEATPVNDRGPVDAALAIAGVTLAMPPSAGQQADLDAFLEAQRDPSSPDFQHSLTPEEFAGRFGASQNDIDVVASWLRALGLNVDRTARGRNFVVVSGTAAQLSSAFSTGFHYFESGGIRHFANTASPSIPRALSGIVTAIRGLDDFKPAPMHIKINMLSPDYTSSSGAHYLAPDDFATIYDISRLYQAGINGAGQKVAVVGQTDFNSTDIRAFRTQFNLPANTPQVVLTGRDPGTSSTDLPEAELDLEWMGAVARNATILYVNSTNVFTSAQYAIDEDLAPVISMSYGGCEAQNSSSLRSLAQQANAEGITWLASSGDSGAAGCDSSSAKTASHGLAVNIPASFPEVTGVGGSTFNEGAGTYWGAPTANSATALSYIPETSWNDTAADNALAASGGGASVYYAKPTWQSGTGVPNDGARDVPDLALTASANHDGYLVYYKGALAVFGGTSAPTPSFAGVVGLLNQYLLQNGKITKAGLGNINPSLYHLATTAGVFHDITSGNNIVPCQTGTKSCTSGTLGYSASVGYDQVTGLGSTDVYQLFTNWAGIASSAGSVTSLTANPASIASTASTQLTATVRASSGTTVPTGTVSFTTGTKTLGTATLATSGTAATASLTVPAASLATGANTVVATYTGNTSFSGSSASTVITVTSSTTTGSNVVPSVTPNPVTHTGTSWNFTITLKETAGQATTLTNFTVNGASYASDIKSFFGTNQIAAKGTISSSLRMTGLTPPTNVVFGFSGTDPSGRQWSTSLTVPFD